jgi:FAD/FMN-containing dehydrogenase
MRTAPTLRGAFRTDERARAAYAEGAGIYRIVPAAVARPLDLDDLTSLIRWAETEGTGLIPRGAGSGIPGSSVGDGVVVDLRELSPRVLEVDVGGKQAVTSPSITLAELNGVAAQSGLRLPPDPSSGAWASLGGMVSTNAAGARSVKYGSVRRWVDRLDVVGSGGEQFTLARRGGSRATGGSPLLESFEREVAPDIRAAQGLISKRFPGISKNSSGYALDAWLTSGEVLDLFVGAEGTLGFISRITWRLDELPPSRAGLRVVLGSLDAVEPAVRALIRLDPSSLELLDRTFLDLVASGKTDLERPSTPAGTQAMLLVEFEGPDAKAVRGRVGDAVRAVESYALEVVTALTPDEERQLWALRHAASPILASLPPDRRSMQVIEDGCVPLPRLGEYVRCIREAAEAQGLTVVIFGHAGDGNVHVNVLPELSRPDWRERVAALYDVVSARAISLGGTLSGEHGDGRLRTGWLERQYGPEIVGLFRRVKTAFDPRGIFNPGVILAPPAQAISRLKVGADAAVLPGDIATALREIEQTGGYARDRLELADGA